MGNHTSNSNSNKYYGGDNVNNENPVNFEDEPLLDRLDYIATHYILTMDFKSLKKLYEKSYCDKLVLITSNILDKYFTDVELQSLVKRVQPDHVLFFHKSDINSINESNLETRAKLCNQISIFYVKIAHLFAAIVMTINPEFIYTDSSGKTVKRNLLEKDYIPIKSKIKVSKTNICDKRISALKNLKITEGEHEVCYFNLKKDGSLKTLKDEPGIPELYQLYLDDNFDYETGNFLEMSPMSREQFMRDLTSFYREFTGEYTMPSSITKFSDIKLRNYGKTSRFCAKKGGDGHREEKVGEEGLERVEETGLRKDEGELQIEGEREKDLEKEREDLEKDLEKEKEKYLEKEKEKEKYLEKEKDLEKEKEEEEEKDLEKEKERMLEKEKYDPLLINYANNLKQMISSATEKQRQLLNIINAVFIFVENKETDKKNIRINPSLTHTKLQKLIEYTRSFIVELYLKCETDFTKGIQLYEAIVESRMFQSSQRQINTLQKTAETLIQNQNQTINNL